MWIVRISFQNGFYNIKLGYSRVNNIKTIHKHIVYKQAENHTLITFEL